MVVVAYERRSITNIYGDLTWKQVLGILTVTARSREVVANEGSTVFSVW